MEFVKDFRWNKGMSARELAKQLGEVGFQSTEMSRAIDAIVKMKKSGAKIFLTFTSNMVTSGLRGFFAQLAELGFPSIIVTTAGSVEEDIMKALGEHFFIGSFFADDIELHERGMNRVGNLLIANESYGKFEDAIKGMLRKLYKKKKRWPTSELLKEIGLQLSDKNSFLHQAAKHNIPVFCPAITDGAIGFHLFLFQQSNPDFVIDSVKDFSNVLFSVTQDDRKGIIALGGGVAKHYALLAALLNGGVDYAVYLTTSSYASGSVSGATTREAKSWGKIKDDSDASTVIGDATITFPLIMTEVLERLSDEGLIDATSKED